MLLILASCGQGSAEDEDALSIVVSTNILGDVVTQLTAEDASVDVLIPVGVDPHDFQPSARQVAAISEADLVVVNGLGLEEGLDDVVESAESDGVAVLEIAPLVDPLPFEPHDEDEGNEGEEGHEGLDPHVWTDPIRMSTAVTAIADKLKEVAPEIDWTSRAGGYAADLAEADETIKEVLAAIPEENRKLVTSHDSLGYFADRYQLEVIGVVIPGGSTLADPSSEELAALVETMRREGVTAIFGETTRPSALAETLAAELGADVKIVELFTGSLGEAGSGADTLPSMLVTNAKRIAEALGG